MDPQTISRVERTLRMASLTAHEFAKGDDLDDLLKAWRILAECRIFVISANDKDVDTGKAVARLVGYLLGTRVEVAPVEPAPEVKPAPVITWRTTPAGARIAALNGEEAAHVWPGRDTVGGWHAQVWNRAPTSPPPETLWFRLIEEAMLHVADKLAEQAA